MKVLATVGILVTAIFLAGSTMANQSTNPYGYNYEPMMVSPTAEGGGVYVNPANDFYGYQPMTPSTTATKELNSNACPNGVVRLWDRIFAPDRIEAALENCPAPMRHRWL